MLGLDGLINKVEAEWGRLEIFSTSLSFAGHRLSHPFSVAGWIAGKNFDAWNLVKTAQEKN